MRCLGCGYYDDEPQAQRMCEAGEGAGHAFVRVGPDGCVPAPDDDPATLRARLQERYERPERPCTYDPADGRVFNPADVARASVDLPPGVTARLLDTATGQHVDLLDTGEIVGPKYDPADEEPEAEPVAIHNPDPACRCVDCRVALGEIVRYTPPEDPGYFGVTEWSGGTDPSIVGMTCRNADEEGPPPVPALGYVLGARLENIDSSIVPPDGTIMDLDGHRVVARNGEWHGHHLGVLGYSELHPDRVVVFVPNADPLRSYLRTLTNPDATAEDVAAALDLLTDEDFALVDPRNVDGFKLLAALPLMKRVRA